MTDDILWSRLTPRQPAAYRERDEEHRFIPTTRSGTPSNESDEFTSEFTESSESSQFTFTPATWTPQESQQLSPLPPDPYDNTDMADITNCSFTGKPEDQDPQDFMNRLERIILMKTGLTETDKVRFLELSLKAKSPAAAWFVTLNDGNKKSFAAARTAFEVRWPVKATTEKTTAEKQALLDETILKIGDLGRRVAASAGAEEELSHIVWADKVERLAGDIPDTNNLLVVSTRKKLPKPIVKLIGLKAMTWKELTDAVRSITLEELLEKIEEERDLIRYALASRNITPNTPSKALGTALQGISITQQPRLFPTNSYNQPEITSRNPLHSRTPRSRAFVRRSHKSAPHTPKEC